MTFHTLLSCIATLGSIHTHTHTLAHAHIHTYMHCFLFSFPSSLSLSLCFFCSGVGEDSVLCLANTCSIADKFDEIGGRFNRLLRARAHLHHYTEDMELDDISAAGESLRQLAGNYRRLEKGEPEEPEAPTDRRIRVL